MGVKNSKNLFLYEDKKKTSNIIKINFLKTLHIGQERNPIQCLLKKDSWISLKTVSFVGF